MPNLSEFTWGCPKRGASFDNIVYVQQLGKIRPHLTDRNINPDMRHIALALLTLVTCNVCDQHIAFHGNALKTIKSYPSLFIPALVHIYFKLLRNKDEAQNFINELHKIDYFFKDCPKYKNSLLEFENKKHLLGLGDTEENLNDNLMPVHLQTPKIINEEKATQTVPMPSMVDATIQATKNTEEKETQTVPASLHDEIKNNLIHFLPAFDFFMFNDKVSLLMIRIDDNLFLIKYEEIILLQSQNPDNTQMDSMKQFIAFRTLRYLINAQYGENTQVFETSFQNFCNPNSRYGIYDFKSLYLCMRRYFELKNILHQHELRMIQEATPMYHPKRDLINYINSVITTFEIYLNAIHQHATIENAITTLSQPLQFCQPLVSYYSRQQQSSADLVYDNPDQQMGEVSWHDKQVAEPTFNIFSGFNFLSK